LKSQPLEFTLPFL